MLKSVIRQCSARAPMTLGSDATVGRASAGRISSQRTVDIMKRLVNSNTESFPLTQRDFVDRRRITFRSGRGGEPAPNSVRGQKTSGPAFGGHGGSVILRGSSKVESLSDLPEDDTISADPGGNGSRYSRGLHARDKVIDVPLGTVVRERVRTDKKTSEGRAILAPRFVYQFLKDKDELTLCDGGKGGVAPLTFKKGDGRKGANGESKSIDLELRLVNDCSLIGLPNSGKTSIISSLTSSLTRIGPEPYSTTRPHLGTIQYKNGLAVKIVDLPGIHQGDAHDKQRGIRILRHTWRSKLLIYCLDMDSDDPYDDLELLRTEVRQFGTMSKNDRKELIVATKCDLLQSDSLLKLDSLFFRVQSRISRDIPVVGTSARFGLGIHRLVMEIQRQLYPDAVGFARPRVPAEFTDTITAPTRGAIDS